MRGILAFSVLGIILLSGLSHPAAMAAEAKKPDAQAAIKHDLKVPIAPGRIPNLSVIPSRPTHPPYNVKPLPQEEHCSHCGRLIVRCRDFACINYKQIVGHNHQHKHKHRTTIEWDLNRPFEPWGGNSVQIGGSTAKDRDSSRLMHQPPESSYIPKF